MHIGPRISTMYGRRASAEPVTYSVRLTTDELYALAMAVERRAKDAETEGDHARASSLWWRSSALREQAGGGSRAAPSRRF